MLRRFSFDRVFRAGTIALFLGFSASVAHGWVAFNGMTTRSDPQKPGYLEVIKYPRAWTIDYWCAAGDHVDRFMSYPVATRVYLVRGPGPSKLYPGRTAVVFTIVPDAQIAELAKQDQGYSLSVKKPGYNMSAGGASAYCPESRRNLKFGMF